ncbi:MAG: fibronectin type domain protein [Myxococcales bacterium]|nr:fibronectin type domain protein [Myxococcales bacterium]
MLTRVLCLSIAIAATTSTVSHAGAMSPVASFGANPGGLSAYEYIPAGLPANAPMVVVLHGCTQSAAAMENAGWQAIADEYKFAVLYPEQTTANNPVRCFNWAGENGDPANLVRGQGENASIMAMIDAQIATHGIDAKRVFVVGFSAGAGFTAVMLATWPERFAAGAIMSGLPYRCATTVNGAFSCLNPGVDRTPAAWGTLVRTASGGFTGTWPKVQIWQGATDTTVAPKNADELVDQWTNVHGITAAPESETIGSAVRTTYASGGSVVVESYRIAGMGHAIVVGTDPLGACSGTTGSYFVDKGVCSTLRAAQFFGLTSGGDGDGSGSGSGSGSGEGGGGDGGDHGAGAVDGGSGCSAGPEPTWLAMLALLGLRRRRARG